MGYVVDGKNFVHPSHVKRYRSRKNSLRSEAPPKTDSDRLTGILGTVEGRKALKNICKVRFFMENISHYSGGRYYAYMLARVMAMYGYQVEIVTNLLPFFDADFADFPITGSFKIIEDPMWARNNESCDADVIIGVPNYGGQYGHTFAIKHRIPFVGLIFETPNYVRAWRHGVDGTDEYWRGYAIALKEANLVLCLAQEPMNWAMAWDPLESKSPELFDYLYPAVNEFMVARVPNQKRSHSIVFIGRHTDFKQPIHILRALKRVEGRKPEVHFIGQVGPGTKSQLLETGLKMDIDVYVHGTLPDERKYEIIKKAKVLVTATHFEGFGMPPAEALMCGTPAVAYDLPVLREAYGELIDLVPMGDYSAMGDAINRLINDKEYWKQRSEEGREYAKETFSLIAMATKIKQLLPKGQTVPIVSTQSQKPVEVRTEPLPSATAGIIILNGAVTLPYAVSSVYKLVDEILIVEGAVEHYAKANPEMVTPAGGSIDNTLEVIDSLPDPDGKIHLLEHSRIWNHKQTMLNVITDAVKTKLFLKLDSDEIWHRHDLAGVFKEFYMDLALMTYRVGYYHFWHGLDKIAIESVWDVPMARVWRWRKDWSWDGSFNYPIDSQGRAVNPPTYKSIICHDRKIYHLNYACQPPEVIQAKINYYANRGIEARVKDTWTDWKPGQAEISPTHGGGKIVPFTGILPSELLEFASKMKDEGVLR